MKHLLAFIVVATLFSGCKKTDRQNGFLRIEPQPYSDVKVNASIQGIVLSELGNPMSGIPVRVGSYITHTNLRGYFFFDNIRINKIAGTVTAEGPFHFKATRTLMVQENSVNFVTLQPIVKFSKGRFQSVTGGVIDIDQGSSIKFDAGSVVSASGNFPYSGEVNIIGAYISPNDPDIAAKMPGNLMGLEDGNYLKQLQTFGMMAIEIRGGSGETLKLASGKTATLSMPIPSSLLANAPATIPLWHFDDTTGLWKKEGEAKKEGNHYVGRVSHFSFWNCDVPDDFVTISMRFASHGGYSFPFHQVKITDTKTGSFTFGTTNSEGIVEGAVPANTKLLREIYSLCGDKLATDEIGPFSSSSDLGTTLLEIPSMTLVSFAGTAKNCSGDKLAKGYADIFLDDMYYRSQVVDGNYSISISRCNGNKTTGYISVTDIDAGVESDPFPVSVEAGSYNIESIAGCGYSIRQYLDIALDDTIQFKFAEPADSFELRLISSGESFISAVRKDQPGFNFKIYFYQCGIPDVCDITRAAMNLRDSLVSATGGSLSMHYSGPRHNFISGEIKLRLRDLDFRNHYEAVIRYKVRKH